MKILFVASEAAPFARSGGLGDVAGALPQAFNKAGHDCRVIIPYYKDEIKGDFQNTFRYIASTYVDLSWRRQYCGVFEAKYGGVTYYLIDNEYYFKRRGLYGHFDDGERFAFFSKAVLEVLPLIDFFPDILHANDWHTALTPVFLDVFYRFSEEYRNIKSVFTIHNIEFQGKYGDNLIGDILGLPDWARSLVMNGDCVNFMKGGIEAASAVTTVSETYAGEILDPFYSYGLESILSQRQYKLHGVVNGIDQNEYDPQKDKRLFKQYGVKDYAKGKAENKKALCEMINLSYDENRPLVAMVTRLTEQKGMDLVSAVIDDIMRADIQMVVLGTGDWKYENMIKSVEGRYPNKFRAILAFSQDLASKLYGASDLFLMPSKFEPCGLSQLIAMRYGSIPIVRETGGLKDTVPAYNGETGEGKGFTFKTYNSYDMLDAVWRAYACFHDKPEWDKVVKNAMSSDFSWDVSAEKYLNLFKTL
ncbi:MAG: glycogen synthase GlgA [Bacteroides sp.]|nr:glycogen synthase GlgA [Bacillota bacterium]MCM1393295.1 glycogen synthase GlgA [[Eubacterium] siraeum]MCM1455735.1 glycogen synthase GlgA [Bacteroides sp.]